MKKLLALTILLVSAQCYAYTECVDYSYQPVKQCNLYRIYVPHGWLVKTGMGVDAGITFYPDESHSWKI